MVASGGSGYCLSVSAREEAPSQTETAAAIILARKEIVTKKLQSEPRVVRSMKWDGAQMSRELLLNREWLVTNGLGGYASGTVSGAITRRYHGLLIAALPA